MEETASHSYGDCRHANPPGSHEAQVGQQETELETENASDVAVSQRRRVSTSVEYVCEVSCG